MHEKERHFKGASFLQRLADGFVVAISKLLH